MRFLPTAVILTASAAAVEEQICTYALEIVQIQDASSSFDAYIDMMQKTADKLLNKLDETFDEYKYAVSSFVDKPVPMRGVGNFGNFKSTGASPDYCYAVHSPLTDDIDVVRAALKEARDGLGSGGDFPENPYEGLLLAAYSDRIGWSPAEQTHSESGRPIARVAVLVTDDIPHYAGDAAFGANTVYPWPRSYEDPDFSTGGFGARNFVSYKNVIFFGNQPGDEHDYYEMSDLFKVIDLGGTLNKTGEARLDALIEKFGPYPFPDIQAHPGDGTAECGMTEYPSFAQVANALTKFNIMPVVLLAEPPIWSRETTNKCTSIGMPATVDCLVQVYTNDLKEMGISAVVGTIASETAIDTIVDAVGIATNTMCIETTTPAPITEATTEAESSDDTNPDASTDETEADETTDETEADETTASQHAKTSSTEETDLTVPGHSTGTEEPMTLPGRSTENGDDTTTSTTTTEKKGSNIPAIAGATGGAVAAAGVAAGVLYKKFGASLFGHSSAGDLSNIQQVETPTSPVDREMMEEISMEAFR